MSSLRDVFGAPRTGFHAARLPGDIAAYDTIGTIGVAMLLSAYTRSSLWATLAGLFVIGEAAHLALGVDTTIATAIKRSTQGRRPCCSQ